MLQLLLRVPLPVSPRHPELSMSRRLAALRVMLAVAAVSALAACASPTAPTTSSRLTVPGANHDVVGDSTCRSGYITGNGFHC